MAGEKPLEKGQHHGDDRVSLERRNEARLGQGNHSRKRQPQLTLDPENGNGRELSRGIGGGEKRAKTGGGGAAIKAASAKSAQKPHQKLEAGMVFTIEPRLTVPDRGVVTIEEMVVVTKDGAEWLGPPQKDIILIR